MLSLLLSAAFVAAAVPIHDGRESLSLTDATQREDKPWVHVETTGTGFGPLGQLGDGVPMPDDPVHSAHTSFRGPTAPPKSPAATLDRTVSGKGIYTEYPYIRVGNRFGWEVPAHYDGDHSAIDRAASTVHIIDATGRSGEDPQMEGEVALGTPTADDVAHRAQSLGNQSRLIKAVNNSSPAWVDAASNFSGEVADDAAVAAAEQAAEAAGIDMPSGAASKIGGVVGGVVSQAVEDALSKDGDNGPTLSPGVVASLTPAPEAISAASSFQAPDEDEDSWWDTAKQMGKGAADGVVGDIVKANIPGGVPGAKSGNLKKMRHTAERRHGGPGHPRGGTPGAKKRQEASDRHRQKHDTKMHESSAFEDALARRAAKPAH